jgi:hypothetical protein
MQNHRTDLSVWTKKASISATLYPSLSGKMQQEIQNSLVNKWEQIKYRDNKKYFISDYFTFRFPFYKIKF